MSIGLLGIIDDIAILADDIAINTKLATQKTAGILGDDLAVNAEKAVGFKQNRELKVIWAITKGSLLNKIIVLPLVFIFNIFTPWIIPYILVIGGIYLLYEAAEKINSYFSNEENINQSIINSSNDDILEIEKLKIKSAVKTDFILSIEIIMIALSSLLSEPLITQIISTTIVALIATFGVYGIVALIVRIDNLGFFFIKRKSYKLGYFLIALMPKIIKSLSVVGTIAMVLVSGGILVHNVPFFHHFNMSQLNPVIFEFIIGIIFVCFILLILRIKSNKSNIE